MKYLYFRRINTLGFVLVIILNTLANALPINGYNTGELSEFYPNLFVPAGFTFSIWGIIYLLLLGFVVFQWAVRSKSPEESRFLSRIGLWFGVSSLANASWILAWHHQQVTLSFLIMLVILGSLVLVYLRLDIGRASASRGEWWCVHLPFSVYLGWITVATIANATALLVHIGWQGGPLSEVAWAATMIAVATTVGLLVLYFRRDVAFAAVLVWAFWGIFSKQRGHVDMDVEAITITALVGMGLLGVTAVVQLVYRKM